MKKKIIGVFAVMTVIALVVALTACGSTKQTSGDTTLDAAYTYAVENGFEGTIEDFLAYVKGDSAYEIAVKNGFEGSEKEWLSYLKGNDGMDGTSASITAAELYNEAKAQGFEGSYMEFLAQFLSVAQEGTISHDALFSSVSVYCTFNLPYTTLYSILGHETGTQIGISAGSGVIYRLNKSQGSAYILTNYHVVYNVESEEGISEDIFVYLYGSEVLGNELYTEEYARQNSAQAPDYRGMGIKATYVGGSQHYDIAVLYVENSELIKNSNVKEVTFADSNEVIASQTAYAVGNAEGKGISVTKGVVSVDSENLTMTVADNSEYTSFRVIRIDTAVNSGNSGGGLFDSEGNLIGIVNAKTSADGVENIGYALPSNVVKYVVENILYYKDSPKKGDVRKCMLGITISSRQSSASYDAESGKVKIKETVMINEVSEGGLADGKLLAGDTLVAVKIHHTTDAEGVYKEYSIDRSFIIVDLMLTMRVGDELVMVYDREEEGVVTRGEAQFAMTEACINEVN